MNLFSIWMPSQWKNTNIFISKIFLWCPDIHQKPLTYHFKVKNDQNHFKKANNAAKISIKVINDIDICSFCVSYIRNFLRMSFRGRMCNFEFSLVCCCHMSRDGGTGGELGHLTNVCFKAINQWIYSVENIGQVVWPRGALRPTFLLFTLS